MSFPAFSSELPALRALARRGYHHDYNLSGPQLADSRLDLALHPAQFHIQEVHRFEGVSNPADQSVLYALISDSGVKGVFLTAYGSAADSFVTELMRPLTVPAPAYQPMGPPTASRRLSKEKAGTVPRRGGAVILRRPPGSSKPSVF